MKNYIFIDGRIRKFEEEKLIQMGYIVIKLPVCEKVYYEIACHSDIFIRRIENNIIIEKNMYDLLLEKSAEFKLFLEENKIENKYKVIITDFNISSKYPNDIGLNLCKVGKNAIHNFKFTDKKLLDVLNNLDYKRININQGYSKCSIAVISDNSCIVCDSSIKEKLQENKIETLLVEDVDKNIKLLSPNGFSGMHGFIGGSIVQIENQVVVFGDLSNIDENGSIRKLIKKQNKEIIEFKKELLIDYGGMIVI